MFKFKFKENDQKGNDFADVKSKFTTRLLSILIDTILPTVIKADINSVEL